MAQDVQAQQSLAVQLQALSEWEHYMFGRLKVFKVSRQASAHPAMPHACASVRHSHRRTQHISTGCAEHNMLDVLLHKNHLAAEQSHTSNVRLQSRFRTATFSLVGGADTEQFSVGAENVHYEGPLQIQLQVQWRSNSAIAFHRSS